VTYVDDVVIGACDPAGAKSLAEAIKLRFGNHPGGPLGFKRLDVHSIDQGFAYLGYWLKLDAFSDQPKVVMRPSNEARKRFKHRLFRRLAAISPKPNWDMAVQVGLAYANTWRAQFPHWQPDDAKLYEFEGIVECWVSDFLSLKFDVAQKA
jgi:hypothetical protein